MNSFVYHELCYLASIPGRYTHTHMTTHTQKLDTDSEDAWLPEAAGWSMSAGDHRDMTVTKYVHYVSSVLNCAHYYQFAMIMTQQLSYDHCKLSVCRYVVITMTACTQVQINCSLVCRSIGYSW